MPVCAKVLFTVLDHRTHPHPPRKTMTTQTTADIVAACMSAVSDRDPRIVAALDYIDRASRLLDVADNDAARLGICFDALDTIQALLSRPLPSTVSQPAPVEASPA